MDRKLMCGACKSMKQANRHIVLVAQYYLHSCMQVNNVIVPSYFMHDCMYHLPR